MKFDCKLAIVDFFANTTDFRLTTQLTEQKCDSRLET